MPSKLLAGSANEFWLAWTFLSRLPAPVSVAYSPDALNRSARFFPWVGLCLGLMQMLVYVAALALFDSHWLAALLAVMSALVICGAFHEDGFADYCDSFGGHDPESRLRIMVDSRLGTFGASGLFFSLAFRIGLLALMPTSVAMLALVFASVLSRWLAVSLMWNNEYAKPEGKSKPLARSINGEGLAFAGLPLIPFVFLIQSAALLVLIVILLVFQLGFSAQLRHRLGGYTGDALGAAQQITEMLVYSTMIAVLV